MFEAANDAVFDTTAKQVDSLGRHYGTVHGQSAKFPLLQNLPRGVAATRGHCAGNGGLRGHSVGGVFPCVIFSQGNPHHRLDWCFLAPDGSEHKGYCCYDEAYAAAAYWLRERAPVSFEPVVGV